MLDSEDLRPPLDVHKRYLDGLKRCAAHKELAAAAALHFCAEHRIVPPKWVLTAASKLICDLLRGDNAKTRGRTANFLARYRQEMRRVERWNAVKQVRQIRESVEHEEKMINEYAEIYSEREKAHYKKMREWLGFGTFACASMYLYGRYFRAGAEAIRTSYRKVTRAHKDPTNTQYWYIEPSFLWQIGIDDRIEVPGTKIVPLYNLTP